MKWFGKNETNSITEHFWKGMVNASCPSQTHLQNVSWRKKNTETLNRNQERSTTHSEWQMNCISNSRTKEASNMIQILPITFIVEHIYCIQAPWYMLWHVQPTVHSCAELNGHSRGKKGEENFIIILKYGKHIVSHAHTDIFSLYFCSKHKNSQPQIRCEN